MSSAAASASRSGSQSASSTVSIPMTAAAGGVSMTVSVRCIEENGPSCKKTVRLPLQLLLMLTYSNRLRRLLQATTRSLLTTLSPLAGISHPSSKPSTPFNSDNKRPTRVSHNHRVMRRQWQHLPYWSHGWLAEHSSGFRNSNCLESIPVRSPGRCNTTRCCDIYTQYLG
jgi:hypothetical protein